MVDIFNKGNFEKIDKVLLNKGLDLLQTIGRFQAEINSYDTDTTINSIRDSLVANYLGFDLINTEKHGFDAKKSQQESFLEIKQCSFSSIRLGGTWNDTNEEKANAFKSPNLFTAVAIWKGACEIMFIVYGQSSKLGGYLLDKVINRKAGSRSTQSVDIADLIVKYNFKVVAIDKSKKETSQILINYNKKLANYIDEYKVLNVADI